MIGARPNTLHHYLVIRVGEAVVREHDERAEERDALREARAAEPADAARLLASDDAAVAVREQPRAAVADEPEHLQPHLPVALARERERDRPERALAYARASERASERAPRASRWEGMIQTRHFRARGSDRAGSARGERWRGRGRPRDMLPTHARGG